MPIGIAMQRARKHHAAASVPIGIAMHFTRKHWYSISVPIGIILDAVVHAESIYYITDSANVQAAGLIFRLGTRDF